MLTGRAAPRFCRRILQHRIPPTTRRCLTTETESNDAALERHFRNAASIARGDLPTAQNDSSQSTTPQPPRRRRRRKDALPPRDPIVDAYLAGEHVKKTTAAFGSNFQPGYQPHTLLSNPPRPSDVTLELLLASQAHMGHSTSLWNPANSRYIFGIRSGIHIISLDTTAQYLRRAAKVVSGVAERGGLVLFVGTRPGFEGCVVRAAQLASPACHLFERWTPGSITNAQQILGRCRMRVVDEFDAEIPGFEEQLFDRAALKPDLVVCLNPLENYVLLHECALATIPTIGIIDTDADPTWVTYPIPANDDSIRAVQVIAGALGRAGQEGQRRRRQAALAGKVSYPPPANLTIAEDFDYETFKSRQDAKRQALAAGSADAALLADPTFHRAMSKLDDGEKGSIAEGDIEFLDTLEQRLSPQERSILRRHMEAQRTMVEQLPEQVDSASDQDRVASAAAGLTSADDADELSAEELEDAPTREPETMLEARRRAAAEEYFGDDAAAAGDDQDESAEFLALLEERLSREEMENLRSAPSEDMLASIQNKLSEEQFERLLAALDAVERAEEKDGEDYEDNESEPRPRR